jgi:hypothetical protein
VGADLPAGDSFELGKNDFVKASLTVWNSAIAPVVVIRPTGTTFQLERLNFRQVQLFRAGQALSLICTPPNTWYVALASCQHESMRDDRPSVGSWMLTGP